MSQIGPLKSITIHYPGVGWVEWCCWRCGDSGSGMMPEPHASEACGVTKTAIVAPPSGFIDGDGI